MKKQMKRIINYTSLIIAMVFATMFSVKAVEPTVGEQQSGNGKIITNIGTITINNVGSEDKLSAYKILDAFYDETTNELTYDFTSDFKEFKNVAAGETYRSLTVEDYSKLTGGDTQSGKNNSNETLDQLARTYLVYLKSKVTTGIEFNVQGSGKEAVATATVPVGAYLIYPTQTIRVYGVMVGNVQLQPSEDGSTWDVTNSTIVAKVADAGVTKTVGSEGRSEGSYTIGDTITYNLKLTVPTYPVNATNKKYTVTDKFSKSLDFKGIESMKIWDDTTLLTRGENSFKDSDGNTVATVATQNAAGENGPIITIEFDVDYIKSTLIKISYEGALNSNAVVGEKNPNNASLKYSNDPYGSGTYDTDDEDPNNPDDDGDKDGEADVYTYGLTVYKISSEDRTPLKGATFEIHKSNQLDDPSIGTISVGDEGSGTFEGLAAGTYFLKETKAPAGYTLSKDAIQVTVGEGGTADDVKGNGYYKIEVENTKGIGFLNLPGTGGIGTIIYTVTGVIIIGMAAYIIVIYRKKNKEQNQE